MKRIKVLLLFLLVIFGCCGCANADSIRAIRHSGFSLSPVEFVCPTLYPESSSTGSFDKIRFLTPTSVITTDGAIYRLSFGQYYSNNTNCKKMDFGPRILSVLDDRIVRTDDKKLYNLDSSNADGSLVEITTRESNYYVYQAFMSDNNVLKAYTVNQEKGLYYVLMRDGNIYNYVVTKINNESAAVTSTSIAFNKSNFGGDIIDFKYAGDSPSTFIRTNESIFRMKITNREECSTYADVKCEYKMSLDEGLTEHRIDILAFSGSFLITTYGKEFSVVNA